MRKPDFIVYQLPDALVAKAGLGGAHIPVRTDRQEAIFAAPSLSLDDLVEEIEAFVTLYPEKKEALAQMAVQLSFLSAQTHVEGGDFTAALKSTSAGLRLVPEHLGLRLHQAFALQICGYEKAAASEYQAVFSKAPEAIGPVAALMCAKALKAQGKLHEAVSFLLDLPDELLRSQDIQQMCERYLFQLEQAEAIEIEPAPDASVPDRRFCGQCGAECKEAQKFCTKCGAALPSQ